MYKQRIIAASVAAAVLAATSTMPAAVAGEMYKSQATQEQSAESAIKDAWLDGKLETALLFNEHVNSFTIDTKVESGVAYLSGTVESEIDKELAGEIAKSIDGVTDVKNELTIDKARAAAQKAKQLDGTDRSFKMAVTDATQTAKVKTKLLASGNTDGLKIDVDTRNGIVTLSGEVDSDEERDLAEKIASNTDGTRSVVNQLTVQEAEEAE